MNLVAISSSVIFCPVGSSISPPPFLLKSGIFGKVEGKRGFLLQPEVLQLEIGESLEIVLNIQQIIATLNLLENQGKKKTEIQPYLI
jgi:hypothetical protein